MGPRWEGICPTLWGWRWIFLVNVPIGIATFFFSLKTLKRHKESDVGGFDFAGFFLSASGLVLLLYALSSIPTHGAGSPQIVVTGLSGLALLSLLVWVESRVKSPILPFSLFRDRLFRAANSVMFFAFAMWIGFLFVIPLFLQQYLGHFGFPFGSDDLSTSHWVVCHGDGSEQVLSCGETEKNDNHRPMRRDADDVLFLLFNAGANLWAIRSILFFRGLTMAFAIIPMQAATFTNISSKDTGRHAHFLTPTGQLPRHSGWLYWERCFSSYWETSQCPRPPSYWHIISPLSLRPPWACWPYFLP